MAENIVELLTDVADAIREKKGSTEKINAQRFADEIRNLPSGGGNKWTGHADAEGLRAIGWTDEDIAYYQENGVNWNEEDDEYHKVNEDNKALYGVVTMDNIVLYKNRIFYLPKIDVSEKTSMEGAFAACESLVAIPKLDTSNVTDMTRMFDSCHSLVCVPLLNTQKVTTMTRMFTYCCSLKSVPLFDTSAVTDMSYMFYKCNALGSIPAFNTQSVEKMLHMFSYCNSLTDLYRLNTSVVTNTSSMFEHCSGLVNIPELDAQNITTMSTMFNGCYSLMNVKLKNIKLAYELPTSPNLSKESLLYIINNEAATSAIIIRLASYAYTRLAEDADIVAALAAHPNISISK